MRSKGVAMISKAKADFIGEFSLTKELKNETL
jgi:hypothetical protein